MMKGRIILMITFVSGSSSITGSNGQPTFEMDSRARVSEVVPGGRRICSIVKKKRPEPSQQ
jgi:hypothetical protein